MHSSGAPLAANREMTPVGDPTNPFSYPFLANMVKAMAKNGVPTGFFLGGGAGDVPAHSGGIDLRTLLLFEAGVLKNPVRLFAPSRRKSEEMPSLSMPSIPESSGEMPALNTRLSNPDEQKGKVGVSPSVVAPIAPSLSLDLSKFTNVNSGKSEPGNTEPNFLAQGPLGMPGSGVASIANAQAKFKFWTVYENSRIPETRSRDIENSYDGSFVLSSPGSVKMIEGRNFQLKGGRLLASSVDRPMAISAPLVSAGVPSGATVLVEIVKPGTVSVKVLESKEPILVKVTSAGKTEEVQLSGGEDLLAADHTLSASELGSAGSSPSEQHDSWAKGKFSVSTLVEKDPFLKVDQPSQSQEQRSAVESLRKRLK